jgi:hypothetical protein
LFTDFEKGFTQISSLPVMACSLFAQGKNARMNTQELRKLEPCLWRERQSSSFAVF